MFKRWKKRHQAKQPDVAPHGREPEEAHQGLGNERIEARGSDGRGDVQCSERLGGFCREPGNQSLMKSIDQRLWEHSRKARPVIRCLAMCN
jgi:hypothetical protein